MRLTDLRLTHQQRLYRTLLSVILSLPVALMAQQPATEGARHAEAEAVIFHTADAVGASSTISMPPMAVGMMGGSMTGGVAIEDNVVFVGPMGMMGGELVKGVPYSATATTERTQRLGDGNRIRHGSTSKTFRDGEGRTRRDQPLPAIGPFTVVGGANGQPSGEPASMSFINDPVARVTYVLNHHDKTAMKMPAPQWIQGDGADGGVAPAMPALPAMPPPPGAGVVTGTGAPRGVQLFTRRIERGAVTSATPALPENVRREDLGKKLIEGIEVQGWRTVFTIPTGAIGNELPIETVNEEWHSPVLQVLVSSTHSDPRMGDNTYQLSNISRAEPDASLFKVPADYTLREAGPTTFNMSVPPPMRP